MTCDDDDERPFVKSKTYPCFCPPYSQSMMACTCIWRAFWAGDLSFHCCWLLRENTKHLIIMHWASGGREDLWSILFFLIKNNRGLQHAHSHTEHTKCVRQVLARSMVCALNVSPREANKTNWSWWHKAYHVVYEVRSSQGKSRFDPLFPLTLGWQEMMFFFC